MINYKMIGLLVGTFLLVGCAQHNLPNNPDYVAELDGTQESPPIQTTASGKFAWEKHSGYYTLTIRGFDLDPTTTSPTPRGDAHFHCAKPTANGPVAYFLARELGDWSINNDGSLTVTGFIKNDQVVDTMSNSACSFDIKTLDDLIEATNAGEIYVNVHGIENPSGEVRGQVTTK